MRYADGITEIGLGDLVEVKRLLRKPETGTVCYVPGASPIHKDMEAGDVRFWSVRLESGRLWTRIYENGRLAPKAVRFVSRGVGSSHDLAPDEELL